MLPNVSREPLQAGWREGFRARPAGQGAGLRRGPFPSRMDNPGVNLRNDCGFHILASVDRLESWAF